MSEEGRFGSTLAERFFGFLLVVIGVLATYYTLSSNDALRPFTTLFGFLSVIPLVLGLFLILVKTE